MDAQTLTGQLRRGRGLGLRRALADPGPEAAEAVYGCLIDDPRDDRQVESRMEYLLRLVTGLRLDCGPIVAHLLAPVEAADDDEWRISLAVDVLAALARDGDTRAAEGLRRYVAEGRYWAWTLSAMWAHGGSALCDGLAPVVLARADDEELALNADSKWGAWGVGGNRTTDPGGVRGQANSPATAPESRAEGRPAAEPAVRAARRDRRAGA
ncbi:hypothetical protein [Dactylosporangium cerinum]